MLVIFSPLLCSSPNFPTPSFLSLSIYLPSLFPSRPPCSQTRAWTRTRRALYHKPKPERFISENMTKSSQWFQRCFNTNTTGGLYNWGMASISNGYFPGCFSFCYCVFCRMVCFPAVVSGHASGHDVRKQACPDSDSLCASLFLALQMSWNLSSKVITVVAECVIVLIL